MRWLIKCPHDVGRTFWAIGTKGMPLSKLIATLQADDPLWRARSRYLPKDKGRWHIKAIGDPMPESFFMRKRKGVAVFRNGVRLLSNRGEQP